MMKIYLSALLVYMVSGCPWDPAEEEVIRSCNGCKDLGMFQAGQVSEYKNIIHFAIFRKKYYTFLTFFVTVRRHYCNRLGLPGPARSPKCHKVLKIRVSQLCLNPHVKTGTLLDIRLT